MAVAAASRAVERTVVARLDRHVGASGADLVEKLGLGIREEVGEESSRIAPIFAAVSMVVESEFRRLAAEIATDDLVSSASCHSLLQLMRAARYIPLSPREIETSRALNERDYLAQTFIKVNTRALGDLPPGFKDLALAEEDLADREDGRIYSRALVWFKGVEVERRRGRLLLEKVDFIQCASISTILDPLGGRQLWRLVARILGQAQAGDPSSVIQDESDSRSVDAVSPQEAFESPGHLLRWPLNREGSILGETELADPNFRRIFLLFNAAGDGGDVGDVGDVGVEMHTFEDIPWASLRLIFPKRSLAFRPLEVVRLDLLSLAALVVGLARWQFVDTSEASTAAKFLEDSYFNLSVAVAGLAVLGRIGFSWFRALTTYELKMSRLVNERGGRTTARGAALDRLSREAADERSKEILLAWSVLLMQGPAGEGELRGRVEKFLVGVLSRNDVLFDEGGEAMAEMEALGLAERLEGGQLRAATPKDALDRLRSRWLDVFEERIL